uniref:LicD/FKTN/FKRP nucleotidyltransferase domain-containing protein n=1 Tax=viral metagenome TaxID=1070528 RepID=A0A6C0CLM1_9ZZZZ
MINNIYINIKIIYKIYFMAGKKYSAANLNKTLLFILKLLNDNDINNWFICYGTLLGLVRENSCIDNDDDVDIIVHKDNYDKLKKILIENNFIIESGYGIKKSRNIIKTQPSGDYASIDIYMADFINDNVYDLWNNLNITDCFVDKENKTFIEKVWNEQKIYYPNNYERILRNRYGKTWEIKIDKKVSQSMRTL